MGFLKNFFHKPFFHKPFFTGWFYMVDLETLKTFLEQECRFAEEHKLELAANLYVYVGQEKHHILIGNDSASLDDDMPVQGWVYAYDDMEFSSLETLINQKLRFLPPYFKINLPDGDSVFLNEYKAAHPELKIEDE